MSRRWGFIVQVVLFEYHKYMLLEYSFLWSSCGLLDPPQRACNIYFHFGKSNLYNKCVKTGHTYACRQHLHGCVPFSQLAPQEISFAGWRRRILRYNVYPVLYKRHMEGSQREILVIMFEWTVVKSVVVRKLNNVLYVVL